MMLKRGVKPLCGVAVGLYPLKQCKSVKNVNVNNIMQDNEPVVKQTPKERAKELLNDNSNSKNMSIWIQEAIVDNFKRNYFISSQYEIQVLTELKKL